MRRLLQLKPTICRAESKHGLVMLKLLDKASDELRILEAPAHEGNRLHTRKRGGAS